MAKSKSSHRWLREHFGDPYVKQAQQQGYRSRAVFKLIEIQRKYKLLRRGMMVVDLGAAPGGWSQIAREWVSTSGLIIALDILPMDPLAGVDIIEGDFTQQATLDCLNSVLGERLLDCVLSDMAPNMSGLPSVDLPRSFYLAELALEFALNRLSRTGSLLIKLFQGEGFDEYLRVMRAEFVTVRLIKPDASRDRSRELYALASGLKRIR